MRSFALFLVFSTLIGFTKSFIRNYAPISNRLNSFSEMKQHIRLLKADMSHSGPFKSHIARNPMFMRGSEMGTEIDPSEDIEYTKGMPDKAQFGGYYRSVVPFGSEMTKTQVK